MSQATRSAPVAGLSRSCLGVLALGLACGPILASCGAAGKSKKSAPTAATAASDPMNAMTFATEDALPPCDAAREGGLAYVQATKSFRNCADGQWTVVDLKGEAGAAGVKGDKGDKGVGGDAVSQATAKAVALYKTYRRSVFRVTLTCKRTTLPACSAKAPETISLGSSFLCGPSKVCTNGHVVDCDEDGSGCYELESFELQAIDAALDSVIPKGVPVAPFFRVTDMTKIKRDFNAQGDYIEDLAKIDVTGLPDGLTPVTLAKDPSAKTVTVLKEVMSLSFPLGFQDLYTDIGHVNTPLLTECTKTGDRIQTKYGCAANYYDFSTTNDTDHGSSGSPLFDIETGTVIGVTSAGTDKENANYTWAIDASKLNSF